MYYPASANFGEITYYDHQTLNHEYGLDVSKAWVCVGVGLDDCV